MAGSIQHILNHLAAATKIKDGKVRFGLFEYEECASALCSHVKCDPEIPLSTMHAILSDCLFKLGGENRLKENFLQAEFKDRCKIYLGQSCQKFVVVADISFGTALKVPRVSEGVCTISIGKVATKFDRSAVVGLAEQVGILLPSNYQEVRVTSMARDVNEGSSISMDSLDYLRGTLNYLLTRNRFTFYGGKYSSLNPIQLGSAFTIHSSGSYKSTAHYLDYGKAGAEFPQYKDVNQFESVWKSARSLRKLIRLHSYGKKLRQIVINYCRALDHNDVNTGLIDLWGIFDELSGRRVAKDRSAIGSNLYKDRMYHYSVVEHLRIVRNRLVHDGIGTDSSGKHILQLKKYVDTLLNFHLYYGNEFSSIHETVEVLLLPSNAKDLDTKLNQVNLARKLVDC